jgi:plastocyanin
MIATSRPARPARIARIALGAAAVLASVMLSLAACGPAGTGPAVSFNPNDPSITANNLKFDTTTLDVPSGVAFSLVFHNQESQPHNVAIYSDAAYGTKLFPADIFTGPGTKIYAVPALAAGTYSFRCDVHPDMKGTVVAAPVVGSPAPSASMAGAS